MALEEETSKLSESNDLTYNSVLKTEQSGDEKYLSEDRNNAEVFMEEEHHDSPTMKDLKEL